jgi:predicted RNA polymerase sigma factor
LCALTEFPGSFTATLARHRCEEATYAEPRPGTTAEGDDTLFLLFCGCHPDLAPATQVALTLRAVGGLTTRKIADGFYVQEPTMAQRIGRAKCACTHDEANTSDSEKGPCSAKGALDPSAP